MLTQYNKNKVKLAIFDLDNTILKIDSDYEMVNYLIDKSLILEKYRKISRLDILICLMSYMYVDLISESGC